MPFESKAQQGYLFAKKPDVAKDFAQHTPAGAYRNLPQHAGDKPNHARLATAKLHRKHRLVTIPAQRKGQQPISFHPGGLHASLGVPSGQKIPSGTMAAALTGLRGVKAKKQALFAKNVLKR